MVVVVFRNINISANMYWYL